MSWPIGPGPIVHLSVPSPHPIGRAIEQVNPIGDKPIYAPKPEQD